MLKYSLAKASSIGVEPALIRGQEKSGMTYFTWADSPVAGAQCQVCSAVVWVDQRRDPILNEARPAAVPESGPGYTTYYEQKLRRFLAALPACPKCGSMHFDRFINNVNFPRLADGSAFPPGTTSKDVIKQDADAEVFLLNGAG